MIERTADGDYEVSCDSCPEAISVDTYGDWDALIRELKEQGWSPRFQDGAWVHYCPDCA